MARAPGLYSGRYLGNVTIVNGSGTAFENSTPAQSHNITLPANMLTGDMMVMVLRPSQTYDATLPDGWTQATYRTASGTTYVWFKRNTGESGTLTVATQNCRICAITYAIRGSVKGCTAVMTGTDSVDPANLTPSWGSQYHVWIAFMTTRFTNNAITTAPTNYDNLVTANNTDNQGNNAYIRLGAATRLLTASAENPGAFTTTGTLNNQHAGTIAVA